GATRPEESFANETLYFALQIAPPDRPGDAREHPLTVRRVLGGRLARARLEGKLIKIDRNDAQF
ncbi:hypothetical protein, partial [uncultured Alistipes sp.]|uniref:hypothetical protein n=1 Tax=uncultured Alistipes sp. TaxID=538949 RepID=UPI00272CF0DA